MFANRTYDGLDPKDESFIKDYEHFKERTFELDRKLGAVLWRAFDDCLITESLFKLLQIFGNLVRRKYIALDLADRIPILVTMLDQEMEEWTKSLVMIWYLRIKQLLLMLSSRINNQSVRAPAGRAGHSYCQDSGHTVTTPRILHCISSTMRSG